MYPDKFYELLAKVKPLIHSEGCNFKKPISAEEKLCVTLR